MTTVNVEPIQHLRAAAAFLCIPCVAASEISRVLLAASGDGMDIKLRNVLLYGCMEKPLIHKLRGFLERRRVVAQERIPQLVQ